MNPSPSPSPSPESSRPPPRKKLKTCRSSDAELPVTVTDTKPDRLSSLSDELLVRILHLLPVECVLLCQTVSRRWHRLAGDGQVWKALYERRFVHPRRRKVVGEGRVKGVDWKARYKLGHNWSNGAAEVSEIELGYGHPAQDEDEDGDGDGGEGEEEMSGDFAGHGKALMARLVDGRVVTADVKEGLRAWDLKSRECVARRPLTDHGAKRKSVPTCISVDTVSDGERDPALVVGFQDGRFEIWTLRIGGCGKKGTFERFYWDPAVGSHEDSPDLNMQLSAVAYADPYLLTMTANHVLSLYVFDRETTTLLGNGLPTEPSMEPKYPEGWDTTRPDFHKDSEQQFVDPGGTSLRLLASLKSHTCWPPRCLSIRSTPRTIIASIAYTLPTYLSGWSVGLQELHLTRSGTILRSRLASAVEQGFHSLLSPSAPSSPSSLSQTVRPSATAAERKDNTTDNARTGRHGGSRERSERHQPTSLSYSHPYLLAGNRDNTLSLYLVTSNNEELKIGKSTTLWGHTSSVSGAYVGGRGKAVSVSARGGELRVWELEGGLGRKMVRERGVLVRREGRDGGNNAEDLGPTDETLTSSSSSSRVYEVQNSGAGWVGFNDEVVVVLKGEGDRDGLQKMALVVYDFT